MTHEDFVSRLFTVYRGQKSPELIAEYLSYSRRFKEHELQNFWEYFTEHYEFSSMPIIGKLEKMRVEYTKEIGDIGRDTRQRQGGRAINEENITDFPAQIQLHFADYWLKLSVPDSPRFFKMLGIIRKYNGEPEAAAREKRIRDAHQDHKNCRGYEYCRNGKKKDQAKAEAKTA